MQVITLQQILNSAGYTVAASGPGSPHHENTYYGAATAAAVAKFQKKYGITSDPSGALGSATRAKLAQLYSRGILK
jgi:peptidoglycan hydrolase-like protein with peptidoglycan-binding domain